MDKKKIIIIAVLVILTGLIFAYFFTKNNSSKITDYKIKPMPSPEIPAGDTFQLQTGQGSIKVNNFLKNTTIIESTASLNETKEYSIVYFSTQSEFLISLNAYTMNDALSIRSVAETDFLAQLGIKKNDACKLTVHVQIPNSYNQDLANTDLGLSFCPGSVQEEKQNNIR